MAGKATILAACLLALAAGVQAQVGKAFETHQCKRSLSDQPFELSTVSTQS